MDARVGAVIEDARPVIRIPERRRFLAQIPQRELRITEIQVIEQRCRCRVFRLKNPKFVESAPEEVVEETRANLAAREEEAGKLETALERLAELG